MGELKSLFFHTIIMEDIRLMEESFVADLEEEMKLLIFHY
jgi:hypothetical protein